MIYLGLDDAAKGDVVQRYCAEHGITKVFVCSPARFAPNWASGKMVDHVAQGDGRRGVFLDWPDIIEYRFYYRLLQEVDRGTLIVVNECLRTQNRHCLTYNCLRLFLNQTDHQIIFQYMPIIDTWEDFAILFDLDTKSRWKREKVGAELLREATMRVLSVPVELHDVAVDVDAKTLATYAKEKAALLAEVRGDPGRDPHLIPRNLYLVGGKAKLAHVEAGRNYVGRSNRFKLPNLTTYKEPNYPSAPYVVFELPHNFIDISDFLAVSKQTRLDVLVAGLPVERWYIDRYQAWAGRLRAAYATLGAP